jgi:hypothetical protein
MKRWLLLSLILPIALVLLAVGVLAFQSSGEAEAGTISGDPVACAVDDGALSTSVDGVSLSSTDNALMSAKCYLVGVTIFPGGCGGDDLYVLRYLCWESGRGWYYANYWYCQ